MAKFVPSFGLKACPALAEWRTDAPESLPHCCVCKVTIAVGTQYAVSMVGNAVFCRSCAGAFRVVKG
jgi:hypothetical protein